MPDSNLHKLSALGQSVWIDYLSRQLLKSGKLARMMEEDAVVGVTSNPTIFQKAICGRRRLRRTAEERSSRRARKIRRRSSCSSPRTTSRMRATCCGRSGTRARVSTVTCRGRSTRRSPTTATARSRRRKRLHDWIDKPNLYVKIPATEPGLGAIEEMIALGKNINVTLIFSLERHQEVMEAYLRGLERLVESGGDPKQVHSVASFFVSRVDTETDKRLDEVGGDATKLKGLLGDRQRQARVPELSGGLRRPTLGGARGEGRDEAALPLGVHVDEEPRVPRRHVRRGADRAGDGGHDARGDDGRLPGSRQGRADLDEGRRGRAEAVHGSARRRHRLRRRDRHARARGRAEVRGLVRRAAGGNPAKRGQLAPA